MDEDQEVSQLEIRNPLLEEGIQKRFEEEIMDMVHRGSSIIDAIVEWCEINEIEPEAIIDLVQGPIKDSIHSEAISRHLIRGQKKANWMLG